MPCKPCQPTNSCDSALPETCEPLQVATEGTRVVVEDQASCKRTLLAPSNPSVLLYDADGNVIWQDGSASQPLNLPQLQTQSGAIPELIGQKANGQITGVTGTATPAEHELYKWTGAQFEPVEISKQFGTGNGILVRDIAAPSLAQWRAGANGQVLLTDSSGNPVWGSVPGTVPLSEAGGRLTLASNTPVMTSDVLTATVLYYTPFVSNQIALYDGSAWNLSTFPELSTSLGGLAADTNFDVFVYNNGGTLTLELTAWTNNTTRATALTRQDGVLVRTGAPTRRYVGTIRTTGSVGQSEFSFGGASLGGTQSRLFVWNAHNRQPVSSRVRDTTSAWVYTTNAWRPANNSSTMRVSFVKGLSDQFVATYIGFMSNGGGPFFGLIGVGFNATNAVSSNIATGWSASAGGASAEAKLPAIAAEGFGFVSAIENGAGSAFVQYSGANGSSGSSEFQCNTWY